MFLVSRDAGHVLNFKNRLLAPDKWPLQLSFSAFVADAKPEQFPRDNCSYLLVEITLNQMPIHLKDYITRFHASAFGFASRFYLRNHRSLIEFLHDFESRIAHGHLSPFNS